MCSRSYEAAVAIVHDASELNLQWLLHWLFCLYMLHERIGLNTAWTIAASDLLQPALLAAC